uniref:Uncharacterized protein n=1 Tax=uncultured marine virus TaxID=186617 RepID=A0A0F7L3Q3_9VIRU|nr:hypothetical protein [uncultured marine virus]
MTTESRQPKKPVYLWAVAKTVFYICIALALLTLTVRFLPGDSEEMSAADDAQYECGIEIYERFSDEDLEFLFGEDYMMVVFFDLCRQEEDTN